MSEKEIREKYKIYKEKGWISYRYLFCKNLIEMKYAIKEADKWKELTSKSKFEEGAIEWN